MPHIPFYPLLWHHREHLETCQILTLICTIYQFPVFREGVVSKFQYIVFISSQWYNCKKWDKFTNSSEHELLKENRMTNIQYQKGDIFESNAQVIVNTVNCQGVMGKGLALAFKQKYPVMFNVYQQECRTGKLRIGKPTLYQQSTPW